MAKEEIKNPWTTLSGEDKYENRWIKVTEYQVINPGGGRGIYGKIHFKNKELELYPSTARVTHGSLVNTAIL
jgi:hypothetical protein